MYERFYGFRDRPFDLTPNPRFLYLTAKHREALSTIYYGLDSRKGITLICGPAGTGKTTLVRAVLNRLQRTGNQLVCLNNPVLTRAEFFELLARSFGLTPAAVASKGQFLIELEAVLKERRSGVALSAVIVDEAQALSSELLEEVRLLANLETATEKLLPLVLVGQPEFAERLEEPQWAQLKQRIALRAEIAPLDLHDTAAYIAGRIRISGGDVAQVFTRDAAVAVFQHSGGIPRIVSVICDNAFLSGFALGVKPITRQVVLEVCADLRLRAAGPRLAEPRGGRHGSGLRSGVALGRLDLPVEGLQPLPVQDEDRSTGQPPAVEPVNEESPVSEEPPARSQRLGGVRRWFASPKASANVIPGGLLFGDHEGKRKRRFLFF